MPSPARLSVVATLLASLMGCSVGPRYQRPDILAPGVYRHADHDPAAVAELRQDWWKLFSDPKLDSLIEVALVENADLRSAAARVDEARALAGIARAARFPELTAGVSASRSRISESGLPPGTPTERTRVGVVADVSFEVDMWGRLRSQSHAALADLLATVHGARAVRVTLVAEVARTWFDLRAADRQLAISHETNGARREWLRLQKLRFDAGVISELDHAQARSEVAATEAALFAFERDVAATENRLAVLIGRNPETLARGREIEAIDLPPTPPPGLPSALLERRPDIAAAEERMVAANARIGLAKAAYFPRLGLTGSNGLESGALSSFLSAGSSIWTAAASLLAPVFNAGRIGREVAAAEARELQAVESYRKTVQQAFSEVETALVERRTSSARRQALSDQVAALEDVLRLGRLRYDAGSSSYLEVLDAQRNLFRAQLELAAARRDELAAVATLYEALGGGWQAVAEPETTLAPRQPSDLPL